MSHFNLHFNFTTAKIAKIAKKLSAFDDVNLVEHAEDWNWCSLWRPENPRGITMLSDWPIERPADWVDFVNEPQTTEELEALRRSVKRGRPLGEDQWRDDMVRESGLEPTMRERGRPSRRKMVETARMPVERSR